MALLNVSEVLLSTEFMQPVKVFRKANGVWAKGEFIQEEQTLIMDALVSAVSEKEIQMIPEADRISEARTFHTLSPLYLTQDTDKASRTSDIVEWKTNKYKIVNIMDNSDYGYYKAYGVLIRGY